MLALTDTVAIRQRRPTDAPPRPLAVGEVIAIQCECQNGQLPTPIAVTPDTVPPDTVTPHRLTAFESTVRH